MRSNNWLARLWQTVEEWKHEPFVWGTNDCCMFAARCFDAMTGSDWVADLATHYTDKASAIAYIAQGGSVEALVTERFGEPVPRLQARRGDACLVETPEGLGIAVCVGGSVLIPGAKGLVTMPIKDVIKAWRID